ncbi:ORF22 [White spot syndrome virus]|uniref:Wsv476 n=3 Tax=White spot syndrome virus TaxID=342409 RepID=Q77IZ1_WSSVS|nr:wsv476 [Shrimp white spot syndrome virus]YP_009220634.1 hypothetical protein SWSSV_gp160 [White spot syndrome virus]AAK77691.1 ORF22 [White spot syndrome virus]AAL33477.1 wsv476 [Shrimp white spot syndrome virus]AAL88871.1 WSSV003 [Shrimp white spot syndrome virus]AFX59850.1 wsv476 [White spot syndrome virus]ALN66278.1 hypothetical protein [White spot syndrome virus]
MYKMRENITLSRNGCSRNGYKRFWILVDLDFWNSHFWRHVPPVCVRTFSYQVFTLFLDSKTFEKFFELTPV